MSRTRQAGLYLWAEHPAYDCRGSVEVLAAAGILVAPGDIYGPAGARHIRVGPDRDRRAHRRRRQPPGRAGLIPPGPLPQA